MIKKLLFLLVLLLTATIGAWAQDYYAPSTDEVIILNDVYDGSKSGYSSHSAIAWGGAATTSNKKAGDPNKGGQPTSSTVKCYTVKGTGQGKNITLSITGVSKVIVYYHSEHFSYIELRDGSKGGNIIGSGQTNTYYTEVELTATNKYSIFLHGTNNGSDDVDFYVYAIKLIAAPAPATTYSVTLAEGTEDADKWTVKVGEGEAKAFPVEGLKGGETVTVTYTGSKKVLGVKAEKKAAATISFTVMRATAGGNNSVTYTVDAGTTWQQFIESGNAPASLSIGTYGTYNGKVCHDMDGGLTCCAGTLIANVADKKRVKASDAIIDGATYGCSDYCGYEDHD